MRTTTPLIAGNRTAARLLVARAAPRPPLVRRQLITAPDNLTDPRSAKSTFVRYVAVVDDWERRQPMAWTTEMKAHLAAVRDVTSQGDPAQAWRQHMLPLIKLMNASAPADQGTVALKPEELLALKELVPKVLVRAQDVAGRTGKNRQVLIDVFGQAAADKAAENFVLIGKHLSETGGDIDARVAYDHDGSMASQDSPALNQGSGAQSKIKVSRVLLGQGLDQAAVDFIHEASHGCADIASVDLGYPGSAVSNALLGSGSAAALLNAPTYEIAAARTINALNKDAIDGWKQSVEPSDQKITTVTEQHALPVATAGQMTDQAAVSDATVRNVVAWADYLLTEARVAMGGAVIRAADLDTKPRKADGWKQHLGTRGTGGALGKVAELLTFPIWQPVPYPRAWSDAETEVVRLTQRIIADLHIELKGIRSVSVDPSSATVSLAERVLTMPQDTALKSPQGAAADVIGGLAGTAPASHRFIVSKLPQIIDKLATLKGGSSPSEKSARTSLEIMFSV